MNEFDLIRRYFANHKPQRKEVVCGIGDDAAILDVPIDQQLIITVDTLIEGIHFPKDTSPQDIGYKSLAVNISDLAAMGATPAWITLAITLPKAEEKWLHQFSDGLFSLAEMYDMDLIGGDTTKGPLTITIQAHGFVPKGKAITRSGAQPGDLIYVTNTIGDAGLALQHVHNKLKLQLPYVDKILACLNRPQPRIKEGLLLRGNATAMIDISDGLAADLGHILQRSGVGAVVDVDRIPCSTALLNSVSKEAAYHLALTSGDDYELCFTLPTNLQAQVEKIMADQGCSITCIGHTQATHKLELLLNNQPFVLHNKGYLHFV